MTVLVVLGAGFALLTAPVSQQAETSAPQTIPYTPPPPVNPWDLGPAACIHWHFPIELEQDILDYFLANPRAETLSDELDVRLLEASQLCMDEWKLDRLKGTPFYYQVIGGVLWQAAQDRFVEGPDGFDDDRMDGLDLVEEELDERLSNATLDLADFWSENEAFFTAQAEQIVEDNAADKDAARALIEAYVHGYAMAEVGDNQNAQGT